MEQIPLIDGAPTVNHPVWREALMQGIAALVNSDEVSKCIDYSHIAQTPLRVAKFFEEFLSGYDRDPVQVLTSHNGDVAFEENRYDQMIVEVDIPFTSLCAHHLLPFFGVAHFGYLPDRHIVGLSKIPRLVDMFAHRLQLQEQLTQQIVDTFQTIVEPKGCGLVIEAAHMCMSIRGIKKVGAVTSTNALTGEFIRDAAVRNEFLQTISRRQRETVRC